MSNELSAMEGGASFDFGNVGPAARPTVRVKCRIHGILSNAARALRRAGARRADPSEPRVVCSAVMRIAAAALGVLLARGAAFGEPTDSGRRQYEATCSRCHGADGNGG